MAENEIIVWVGEQHRLDSYCGRAATPAPQASAETSAAIAFRATPAPPVAVAAVDEATTYGRLVRAASLAAAAAVAVGRVVRSSGGVARGTKTEVSPRRSRGRVRT